MALTVVKYKKLVTGETTATPAILIKNRGIHVTTQQTIKRPVVSGGPGLTINKIPATIKATMKRTPNLSLGVPLAKKYSVQTVARANTPITGSQWQKTIGGPGGTTITSISQPKQPLLPQHQLVAAISSLPSSTIIQAKSSGVSANSSNSFMQSAGGRNYIMPVNDPVAVSAQGLCRSNIFTKREQPERTLRTYTIQLIEKNPLVHIGVSPNRIPLLKNVICPRTNVTLHDCYLTLKKLRQNESFAMLGEYFELSVSEVEQTFVRSLERLAIHLRDLICWPDSQRYYDRHKNLPFAFRPKMSHVQSLIECVATDMHLPAHMTLDCSQYKFILCVMPNGIISYISEAFLGIYDDLVIFNAVDFKNTIPKYLSMVVDPGKGIRNNSTFKGDPAISHTADTDSTTDSAEESADELENNANETDGSPSLSSYASARVVADMAGDQTLHVTNNELRSSAVKDFSVPIERVYEPVCREQILSVINSLREFKILQPFAFQEPLLYQYLNEILIVAAAISNIQR